MGKKPGKSVGEWLEAKRRCGLSDEEVRMAKELGFKPRSLLKNIPAKTQPWKAPVREWIRELYDKRFGDIRGRSSRRNAGASPISPTATTTSDSALEDLLPEYDTTTGEPYFVRGRDGKVFTLEEAGHVLDERDVGGFSDPDEEIPDSYDDLWDDSKLAEDEIESEDQFMLRRQHDFRVAAEAVAAAMSRLAEVQKIALFGSVARPLEKELPRFRSFRRARMEISHECSDVDLAVWVRSLAGLKAIQKARSHALNDLLASRGIGGRPAARLTGTGHATGPPSGRMVPGNAVRSCLEWNRRNQ